MTEAAYLRGELIKARALLADCAGIFAAADTLAPELTALPSVEALRTRIAEFQTHGVAVLPAGVAHV